MTIRLITPVGLLALALAGCEGKTFTQPPIHLQQNMDFQKKFEAQEENPFYGDKRAMRYAPENTVAQGYLKTDEHLYQGKVEGEWATTLPAKDEKGAAIQVSESWLERGQDRFGIYCSPCHGFTGVGNGLVVQRGMVRPTSLYDERLQGMGVGYFFHIITNGKNNMMPYKAQIPVRDRWAIASFVRVLQRSRAATFEQVPAAEAQARGWSK
ncbi:MAG: cytochrome c [Myxococcota bacterium]